MNTEMLDMLTREERTAYALLEKAGLLEEKENNDDCLQCGYDVIINRNCINCGAKSGCLD